MAYQAETCWMNNGLHNCCVWLHLLWFWLKIQNRPHNHIKHERRSNWRATKGQWNTGGTGDFWLHFGFNAQTQSSVKCCTITQNSWEREREREREREICATEGEWGKTSRKPSGLIPNRRKQSRNVEKRRWGSGDNEGSKSRTSRFTNIEIHEHRDSRTPRFTNIEINEHRDSRTLRLLYPQKATEVNACHSTR